MQKSLIRKFACLALTLCSTPSPAVIKEPVAKAWVRLDGSIAHTRFSPKSNYIAFTDADGQSLRILDTKTQHVALVSSKTIGPAFFWAPDGTRLFYRELAKTKDQKIESTLRAFDCSKLTNIDIEKFPYITGLLNFDPRDLRMHFLSVKGLHTKKFVFPDERLARWQIAQRTEHGKWIVAQNGVIWATEAGFILKRMDDDQSPVQAFDISPDGNSVAWATTQGMVYTSTEGQTPKFVGKGQDPRWHPYKSYLLYSASRMVGNKVINYDLKLVDAENSAKFLTHTQGSDERWPTWHPDGQSILYTVNRSTDLYQLEFSSL